MHSLPVSVSTTDLATLNLQAELRSATQEALEAIGALLPLASPQRLLLTPRRAHSGGSCGILHGCTWPTSIGAAPSILLPMPAPVGQTFSATKPCRNDIRAQDVVLSELLNQRGPVAWLAASCSGPTTSDSSCSSYGIESVQESKDTRETPGAALVQLAQRSIRQGEVLVLSTQAEHFDLLLLPRQAAAADGVAFAVFATQARASQGTASSAQCGTCFCFKGQSKIRL